MEQNRIYTPSQVEQHKSKQDCWFIINGRVLNVTKFLEEHPGGEEVLIEHAGKDASKVFSDIGHSKVAHGMLSRFQVGRLQSCDIKDIDDASNKQLPEAKEMEAFVIEDDPTSKNSIFAELLVPFCTAVLYLGYLYLTGAVNFRS